MQPIPKFKVFFLYYHCKLCRLCFLFSFYLNFSFNFSLSLPTGADDCYLIIYYLSVSLVIFRYLDSVLQFQLTAFQRIRGPFVLVFCSILGSPRLSLMLGHPSRGGATHQFFCGPFPLRGGHPSPSGCHACVYYGALVDGWNPNTSEIRVPAL